MRSALIRSLFTLLRLQRPPASGSRPRAILVLQYAMPLGCCVHNTPLLAALKAQDPTCTLIVATRGTGAAVLLHNPHIDVLLETASPLGGLRNPWAAAGELRKKLRAQSLQPQFVLVDGSSRSGTYALLAASLRLAPTAGFTDQPGMYDHPLAYDPDRSLIDNNLRLAELVRLAEGLGPPTGHTEPSVYFTAREAARARELLAGDSRPAVGFVLQGSGGQRTGWHDERFAAVIRYVESLGYRSVFFGTAADSEPIDRIARLAESTGLSLAGQTSIPELTAALCLCDLLIAIDTGTMHLGRAAEVPMVVLGPSWQKPIEWLPLGRPGVRILRGPDRERTPAEYRLDEIGVSQVVAAAAELLELYPPAAPARETRLQRLLSDTRP